MKTMLLFLIISFAGGIALTNKPAYMRWALAILLSLYMCFAFIKGGAQF